MSEEVTIQTQQVFSGRLIHLRVDTVRMPDGSEHQREIVTHPGAVAIVPVLPNGDVLLVRQYRHAIGRQTLELPAGTREPGEAAADTALRELREETGYTAQHLAELVRFFVSPGWTDEELVVYLALDITAGPASAEPDEIISTEEVSGDEIAKRISDGDISDAKSIVGLLAWRGILLSHD